MVLRCLEMYEHEPGHDKICLMPYANNKGADQPAHLHSLIRTFIVRCLDSLSLVLPGRTPPKTDFLVTWHRCMHSFQVPSSQCLCQEWGEPVTHHILPAVVTLAPLHSTRPHPTQDSSQGTHSSSRQAWQVILAATRQQQVLVTLLPHSRIPHLTQLRLGGTRRVQLVVQVSSGYLPTTQLYPPTYTAQGEGTRRVQLVVQVSSGYPPTTQSYPPLYTAQAGGYQESSTSSTSKFWLPSYHTVVSPTIHSSGCGVQVNSGYPPTTLLYPLPYTAQAAGYHESSTSSTSKFWLPSYHTVVSPAIHSSGCGVPWEFN